jgi:hypothetical protein
MDVQQEDVERSILGHDKQLLSLSSIDSNLPESLVVPTHFSTEFPSSEPNAGNDIM